MGERGGGLPPGGCRPQQDQGRGQRPPVAAPARAAGAGAGGPHQPLRAGSPLGPDQRGGALHSYRGAGHGVQEGGGHGGLPAQLQDYPHGDGQFVEPAPEGEQG